MNVSERNIKHILYIFFCYTIVLVTIVRLLVIITCILKCAEPRKEWDEEALKAVEELLHGPPVGLHQLEELKGQIPALTKFSAMQIYVKLYSRKQ